MVYKLVVRILFIHTNVKPKQHQRGYLIIWTLDQIYQSLNIIISFGIIRLLFVCVLCIFNLVWSITIVQMRLCDK